MNLKRRFWIYFCGGLFWEWLLQSQLNFSEMGRKEEELKIDVYMIGHLFYKFGFHTKKCNINLKIGPGPLYECDCGYPDALDKVREFLTDNPESDNERII